MRDNNLYIRSDADLLNKFIEISIKQDEAEMAGNITRFNRLVDQKIAIVDVLRSRPGDGRALLTSLYEHQNLRVRLNAALDTLAVVPLPARGVLERLRDWKFQPYAAEAWNVLDALDGGTFVPT